MVNTWRAAAVSGMVGLLVLAGLTPATAQPGGPASREPAPTAPMPEDFHWGVATSGYQVEGDAPDSNWRRYVDGKAKTIDDPYGEAVDFKNRYPEDIARAKELGTNTFRISIEWARVEPRPGVIDQEAVAFYDDVVRKIEDAGMTPMITLTHFVHPGWISDRGGWSDAETIDRWLDFSQRVVSRYSGHDVLWITFNEPAIYRSFEEHNGGLDAAASGAMAENLVTAHRRGYDLIHRLDPTAKVSSNLAYKPPPLQGIDDAAFIDKVKDKLDFVGIDYYYGLSLDNLSAANGAFEEFWKIEPQPDGIYYALKEYQRKFPGLPMYVVENGMPTDDGNPRPDGYTRSDHLNDHIYWVQRAMAEGVDVMGYNYWSLTDNYEWGDYRSRFGLYTVDVLRDPTLTRRPTDAVATYHDMIARGGVPDDYTPKRRPAWCAFADLRTCLAPLPT